MTWSDISIKQGLELLALNDEIKNIPDEDMYITAARQMAVIYGGKEEDYLNQEVPTFINKYAKIKYMLENVSMEPKFIDKIKIGSTTYDLSMDVSKMKTAQFMDLDQVNKTNPPNYFLLMSAVWIPRDENGKRRKHGEDYSPIDVGKLMMDNLSIEEALGIANFYSALFTNLHISTLTFLVWKLKRALKKETDLQKKIQIKKSLRKIKDSIKIMGGSLPLNE